MEMKPISSGRLRAIGYDAASRKLRVRFDDGSTTEYNGIGQEIWRRLSTAASAWSVFRDNIEEEFTGQLVSSTADTEPKKNPLDDLFGKT
jgi:YD repeat-containing protein